MIKHIHTNSGGFRQVEMVYVRTGDRDFAEGPSTYQIGQEPSPPNPWNVNKNLRREEGKKKRTINPVTK